MSDAPTFDTTNFDINPYLKRVDKPWGYEIHWVPSDAPYMGKIICIDAGKRLSLQVHDEKSESWLLVEGQAAVAWEDNLGNMVETKLRTGTGFTTKVGQKHRLIGVTDCKIVEVSTPELGTTWRLEDDFARPHETPEQRAKERGES